MAEVLATFTHTVVDGDRNRYRAQASGAPTPDGTWQGWVEFIPLGGGLPIRSGRETTQPNRADAVYWATGLTPVYLEGALERARRPLVVHDVAPSTPAFDEPAPHMHVVEAAPTHEAVLNPYSAYEKGEALHRGLSPERRTRARPESAPSVPSDRVDRLGRNGDPHRREVTA